MIRLTGMPVAQEASWHALMDLAERVPLGWTLIGGQMVHLHCAERGYVNVRPTDDGDAVLDAKENPQILGDVTGALKALGMVSAGVSADGHEHRWVRGTAQVDVLLARGVGERTALRGGVSGSTTVQAPGGQYALNRSVLVEVTMGDRVGVIRRPSLVGALISKAAAHTIPGGRGPDRHRTDFAILSSLLTATDLSTAVLNKGERNYLRNMIAATRRDADALQRHPGALRGLERLSLLAGCGPNG